ncbi:unnamed protein product, partial [Medioppia subpectinata]
EEHDYLLKIILIGDSGVGKTSLMRRYTDGIYSEGTASTIGVDFKIKTITVNSKRVKLQIWDTAGQERFKSIVSNYYRGANGLIVVFDLLNKESFDHLDIWIKDLQKKNATVGSEIIILGNKVDEKEHVQVTKEDVLPFLKKYSIPHSNYYEVSAKENLEVETAFVNMTSSLVEKFDKFGNGKTSKVAFKITRERQSEKSIIDSIAKYARSLSYSTTPRIAGGWVRDKIMGLDSNDMDVSVDNVSGFEFASGLVESLSTETPNIHKILANPEKSKHLETAVVKIYGMDVDFVHLRDETYSTTRIPVVSRGTAKSDAMRRDITINSLFYNILTRKIEDFSERGISDIKLGIIDTPLDPKVTLFDDPLRILRIFRFQAKFGFTIHKRIIEAIDDDRIRKALKTKVSNERIWKELSKMLGYKRGNLGLIEIAR